VLARLRVLQISDETSLSPQRLVARIEALAQLPAAARCCFAVQLRDPLLPARELLALGLKLRGLTRRLGAGLVVNDRLDLARLVAADGVHLGRRSVDIGDARKLLGRSCWVSVSAHDQAGIEAALGGGADAVLLSPIFDTPGKGPALGLDALRQARALLDGRQAPRLLALGGVDQGRGLACLQAGADGVASIRADLTSLLAM